MKKIASYLPKLGNVIVEKEMMEKNAKEWQAHLMQIADFLLSGPGVWWKWNEIGDVEFLDSPKEPKSRDKGPTLHHFKSSSIQKEISYLTECWERCCEEKVELPLYKLYSLDGKLVFKKGSDDLDEEIMPQDVHTAQQPQDDNVSGDERAEFECVDERVEDDESDQGDNTVEEMMLDDDTNDESDQDNYTIEEIMLDDDTNEERPQDDNIAAENSLINDNEVSKIQEDNDENTSKQTLKMDIVNLETTSPTDDQRQQTFKKQCTYGPLKSKTSKAIEIVVGRVNELEDFDNMKHGLSKNPHSRYYIKRFETSLAKIQVIVLKVHSEITKQIQEWDKNFFQENNFLPQDKHYQKDSIKDLLKRKKVASQLLSAWKITVHL